MTTGLLSESAVRSTCPNVSAKVFQPQTALLPCELVASKNRDGRRQKLVLQSVFLLMSLLGIISSIGCCSRNAPLTWFKGQLIGSGWRIQDLLDRDPGFVGSGSRIRDCWIGIEDPGIVGSRIRLIEEQRRPEREGNGAGRGQF